MNKFSKTIKRLVGVGVFLSLLSSFFVLASNHFNDAKSVSANVSTTPATSLTSGSKYIIAAKVDTTYYVLNPNYQYSLSRSGSSGSSGYYSAGVATSSLTEANFYTLVNYDGGVETKGNGSWFWHNNMAWYCSYSSNYWYINGTVYSGTYINSHSTSSNKSAVLGSSSSSVGKHNITYNSSTGGFTIYNTAKGAYLTLGSSYTYSYYFTGGTSTTKMSSSVTTRVCNFTSTSGTTFYFYKVTDDYQANATRWATFFNDFVAPTCANLTPPTEQNWTYFKNSFNVLNASTKTLLTGGTANPSGGAIGLALSRYDYILAKYGSSYSYLTNFLNRTIVPLGQVKNIVFNDERNTSIALVVVVSVVSVSSIGLYIYLERKHSNEKSDN